MKVKIRREMLTFYYFAKNNFNVNSFIFSNLYCIECFNETYGQNYTRIFKQKFFENAH